MSNVADIGDSFSSHFADLFTILQNRILLMFHTFKELQHELHYLNVFTRGLLSISSFLQIFPISFIISRNDSEVKNDWWRLKNIIADCDCWLLLSQKVSRYKWEKIGNSSWESSCLHLIFSSSFTHVLSLAYQHVRKIQY